MKQRIEDALVVTMNERDEVIEHGSLVIDGDRLEYVGPSSGCPREEGHRVIDGSGFIAIPGLVNAHCHSPANVFRGLMPARPLEIWRAYWRAALRACSDDLFYASALLGAMEMLKTGCTTMLDHFFGNRDSRFTGAGEAVRAMRDLGLRHVVALTVSDRPYEETIPLDAPEGAARGEVGRMTRAETGDARGWLDEIEEFIAELHDPRGLTTCCPGPSAVQRCTDELLRGASAIADRCGVPLHIHLAESRSQALMGPRLYGTSLLKHLDDLGLVTPNLSAAHSVWIDEEDVEIMVRRGATPVHNPASNLRLGSGLAPIPDFLAAGGRVALGADGACSNDNQNLFDAMRLAALVHNTRDHDFHRWVTARQAMSMATRWGARAFGLDCGALEPGRLADVVLLNRRTPAFTPLNDVTAQLVFCENGGSVDTVLVNGEVVVAGGRLRKMDEEAVMAEVNRLYEPLRPVVAREMRDAAVMEPSLSEMYFRVCETP